MKYILNILLIICVFNLNVIAKGRGRNPLPGLTCGLEWGYVATIHSAHHYNFFAPEGYRVDDPDHSLTYISNADMYIHFGYDFSPEWNLSMYVGYEGIADYHNAVPVSLRVTRFFPMRESVHEGNGVDGWLAFADLGSGICLKKPVQEILTGKAGCGYRLALSPESSLDFLMSARFTYTHPQIIYDKHPIAADRINRNNAYLTAISLGMALNF